jgi:hypothetical protein
MEVQPASEIHRLITLARTVIVSIIPLACIIGLRYTDLKLSPGLTGWAVVIALAWAAITLVSAVDPLYKARLGDFRDLISAIRGKD